MIERLFSHRGEARAAGSRGQSLVEFALVLPILLIVVSGVLEVGNVLTIYNRVQLRPRGCSLCGGGWLRRLQHHRPASASRWA